MTRATSLHRPPNTYQFIDLFAGCGGISLGLHWAGWKGCFAIERDGMAFETLRTNLVDGGRSAFRWPDWLKCQPLGVEEVLAEYRSRLEGLCGTVDLLAGGPPCQGFSFAGRRRADDPRNRMLGKYIEFVKLLSPKLLLVENVPGMRVVHGAKLGASGQSHFEKLVASLEEAGYDVDGDILDAASFGVPQRRPRLVLVGVDRRYAAGVGGVRRVLDEIRRGGGEQLHELQLGSIVTARQAISDLEVGDGPCKPYYEFGLPKKEQEVTARRFEAIPYKSPRTPYQWLMHGQVPAEEMTSMRLARHRPEVSQRFEQILKHCRRGVALDDETRRAFGLLKHRTHPMDPKSPAPTITTLPDDVLHYRDPRILTVRESARIQSFPDWFRFTGKYTTGGHRRTKECPRYTQVGNAVPPLLSRAIGISLAQALDRLRRGAKRQNCNHVHPALATT